MTNYNLLYFDRSWLLIAVWRLALNRITHFIQGVLSGIIDKVKYFAKTGEFVVNAKGLVQLASSTTVTAASGTHTVDPGTDCLVVCAGNSGAACTITGGTLGSQSMTVLGTVLNATNGRRSAILYLKNPTVGASTLTITASNTPRWHATNWQGTQEVPFRTALTTTGDSVTSTTLSPTSAIGDVVIDSIWSNLTTLSPNASQTSLLSGQLGVSKKNGAAGTTAMIWTGGAAYTAYVAAALKGS